MDEDTTLEDVQQLGRDFLNELYDSRGVPMVVVDKMNALVRLAHIVGAREALVKDVKSIFPWIN